VWAGTELSEDGGERVLVDQLAILTVHKKHEIYSVTIGSSLTEDMTFTE